MTPDTSYDWLRQALIKAAVPRAGLIPEELGSSPEEAWAIVARVCQMKQVAVAAAAAGQLGMEALHELPPPAPFMKLIPEQVAQARQVLAVRLLEDETLLVAISEPPTEDLRKLLRMVTHHEVSFALYPRIDLAVGIAATYERLNAPVATIELDRLTPNESAAQVGRARTEIEHDPQSVSIIHLVNLLLSEAIRLKASDIHLQPFYGGSGIRFRIDGTLRPAAMLPAAVARRMIGRVKALAKLDPTDSMHPQDGSMRVSLEGTPLDLRISTLPVEGGEKLVIRLLSDKQVQALDNLGAPQTELTQLRALLHRSSGLILAVGPTGCGKTTTLHAAMAEVHDTALSIVTIEDPIEYRVKSYSQVQVNNDAGLTFANALRSVLRQDPDVVLVGEIRDHETAQLAVQASLTGHIVLSTLHTLDAISAIPRLVDLGVLRSFLGELLAGIVAQRLVRRLCPHCRVPAVAPLTDDEARIVKATGIKPLMRASGCTECNFVGYAGRMVVAQVVTVTARLRQLITDEASLDSLRSVSSEEGSRTLAESMLDHIRAGDSTVAEAVEQLGSEFWLQLGLSPSARSNAPLPDERPRVLVLAANQTQRAEIARAVEAADFVVETAVQAAAARDMLERTGHFSALVICLSDMIAERVHRLMTLRDSLVGAALPVIAVGDASSQQLASDLLEHAGVTLLELPLDAAQIVSALRERLGAHEAGAFRAGSQPPPAIVLPGLR